jgi:hypothetical protein
MSKERVGGEWRMLANGATVLLESTLLIMFDFYMQTKIGFDHSPSSSAEFKNEWSYTLLPQYAFMT